MPTVAYAVGICYCWASLGVECSRGISMTEPQQQRPSAERQNCLYITCRVKISCWEQYFARINAAHEKSSTALHFARLFASLRLGEKKIRRNIYGPGFTRPPERKTMKPSMSYGQMRRTNFVPSNGSFLCRTRVDCAICFIWRWYHFPLGSSYITW